VTARNDVLGAHDPGVEVLALHVLLIVLACRGLRAIEGDVAALGADDELVTRRSLHSNGARERLSERALRTLAAVVDGSVEQVDAGGDRLVCRVGVPDIVRVIALAQVAAEANGGNEHAIGNEWPQEIGCELRRDARAVSRVPAAVACPASIVPRVREETVDTQSGYGSTVARASALRSSKDAAALANRACR
jgi:hypothetical protein